MGQPRSKLIISEAGSTKDFMAAYGRAMMSWGLVEHSLCSIFLALLRSPSPHAAGSAFFAILNFRDKTNAVDALLKILIAEQSARPARDKIAKDWKALKDRIEKAVRRRNTLAHLHFWLNGEGVPFGYSSIYELVKLPVDFKLQTAKIVTEQHIRDYDQSFDNLSRDLSTFCGECGSWLA